MIITNSLGSNYTSGDRILALKLLFQPWKWKQGKELETLKSVIPAKVGIYLNRFRVKPGMTVELFLKGRHAIYEALRKLGIGQDDEVIVQAFTCVAVVQPILDLGATPIYVDVDTKNLNPSFEQIKKSATSKTKAIILQHTLGYINRENDEIVKWCRNHKIFIIQDLAHFFIPTPKPTTNNQQLIASANAIILSFSQDKVIDGVSGGALIASKILPLPEKLNDSNHLILIEIGKHLLYPICTWLIRSTYQIGIGKFRVGKVIHWLAKFFGLMNSPVDAPTTPTALPNALAALTFNQLVRLDKIIVHRRNIALTYGRILNRKFKLVIIDDIKNGSNLRYPIWVGNRDELEKKLTRHGFYLMDHWYDAPVSPERVSDSQVKYQPGSCPNTENLSEHIFNLPTHISISNEKAECLAKLINQ
ncbi:DegT/DnrJ/EryC1/StrS family aminotransferase [Candidatus Collierbacteria bacterium]|nr:DegT/DnrJ/EryC1/StrS family aminotransferase [Candidatus Collierbacteria bacterium]